VLMAAIYEREGMPVSGAPGRFPLR
jgi:hypothetical protein